MKEKYIPADIEIILFGNNDVITMSGTTPGVGEDGTSNGSGIGGGYNPDGWT